MTFPAFYQNCKMCAKAIIFVFLCYYIKKSATAYRAAYLMYIILRQSINPPMFSWSAKQITNNFAVNTAKLFVHLFSFSINSSQSFSFAPHFLAMRIALDIIAFCLMYVITSIATVLFAAAYRSYS